MALYGVYGCWWWHAMVVNMMVLEDMLQCCVVFDDAGMWRWVVKVVVIEDICCSVESCLMMQGCGVGW